MGKNEAAVPLRVGLYIRVSGEEQAIKGLSPEAQQEDLEEYVRERGWVIVGVYIDAAKTARKRLNKRTNFLRMLEDVKQDKVDLILFTRLDRWFRSVADYYKVMKVLEAHNCGWLTTQDSPAPAPITTVSARSRRCCSRQAPAFFHLLELVGWPHRL